MKMNKIFKKSYVLTGSTRVASASSYEAAKTLAALARLDKHRKVAAAPGASWSGEQVM